MSAKCGRTSTWRGSVLRSLPQAQRRLLHHDGRNRLSTFWTPTSQRKQAHADEDGHDLLLRAGFLRQAHSGIFHLLPLGLRVQDKVERLLDKHMHSVGATKVSLSSLSSQDLWKKSGRLDGRNAELFQLHDRKEAKFLLSPTHEEEITTIVKNAVSSYRDLPLRLYQVSRKYRDEARPRHGLLRGREFVMKDLYTFDWSKEEAMKTYESVRTAYRAFLDDVHLPYLVANADSGNMGGTHSHEYHFVSPKGEDTILQCRNCDLSMNEELFVGQYDPLCEDSKALLDASESSKVWFGRVLTQPQKTPETKDGNGLVIHKDDDAKSGSKKMEIEAIVKIVIPQQQNLEVNMHALKKLVPNLDTAISLVPPESVQGLFEGCIPTSAKVISFRDPRVPAGAHATDHALRSTDGHGDFQIKSVGPPQEIHESPFLLTKARPSDACPSCGTRDTLVFQKAVEIGHTFHLGTRYSRPLEATVKDENNRQIDIEMGCHGIGVSRLIGAVASLLADDRGLNWPVSIAPFGILLAGAGKVQREDLIEVYDMLDSSFTGSALDTIIDDRERPFGWKLNDADLIGYPFIVVLGKMWSQRRTVELQSRRLGIREEVGLEELPQKLVEYSQRL